MDIMSIIINSMLLDKQEFPEHRFVTIMFDQILKSSFKYFLTNVKQSNSNWIKKPKKFDCTSAIIFFTNLYTNYTSTGHWEKSDSNADTIIALVTALKKERNKNIPKVPKTPGVPSDGHPGLEIWKFESVGKFNTAGGVKHMFCTDNGRKDDRGCGGMYMPFLYDHHEWLFDKQKRQAYWK